jgi:hypothetical protein
MSCREILFKKIIFLTMSCREILFKKIIFLKKLIIKKIIFSKNKKINKMQTSVEPSILFNNNGKQIPVWWIRSHGKNGKPFTILYQRTHRPGYTPFFSRVSSLDKTTTLHVCSSIPASLSHLTVHLEKDGYVAPMSWYKRDETYTGNDVFDPKKIEKYLEEDDQIEEYVQDE